MKTKVSANTEDEARQEVYKKLTIHKVEKAKDDFNDIMDLTDNALNNLKEKK
jgi:hypothetical protein